MRFEDHRVLKDQLNRAEAALDLKVGRRGLLRRGAMLGLSIPVVAGLLAACDDDDSDDEVADDADDGTEEVGAVDDTSEEDEEPDAPGDDDVEDDSDDADGAQHGGILRWAQANDSYLDPHQGGYRGRTGQGNMYDGLVEYDPSTGEIVPALAESWENEDNITYRFHLREDVEFHYGQHFTAEDVIYTIDRILDDAAGAEMNLEFQSVESYEVIDEYTVEMTLDAPIASWMAVLATHPASMISKEWGEEHDPDYATEANGTGPFMLESYEYRVLEEYRRNPNYWKEGLPYLDGIDLRVFEEDSGRVAALRAGDIDLSSYVPWQAIDELEQDPDFEVWMNTAENFTMVRLNPHRPPLDNRLVRHALSFAIDREAIGLIGQGGRAHIITGGIFPPGSEWHNEDLNDYFRYDPDHAVELLEEAGFSDPSEVEIIFYSGTGAVSYDAAEVIVQNWRDIGITVDLQTLDSPTAHEYRLTGDYQAFIDSRWIHINDPDFYTPFVHTGGFEHAGGVDFSDEEIDNLLAEARSLVEFEDRKEVYRQLEERVLYLTPAIFLMNRPQTTAWWTYVHAFDHDPVIGVPTEPYMERVWMEQQD